MLLTQLIIIIIRNKIYIVYTQSNIVRGWLNWDNEDIIIEY